MRCYRSRALALAALLPLAASCSGGSSAVAPQTRAQQQSATAGAARTYDVSSADGSSATLVLRSNTALPASAIALHAGESSDSTRLAPMKNRPACPPVPAIRLRNPFPFPISIDIDSFKVKLRCTPQSPLFGATFYQVVPQPKVVSPVKLGDATISGRELFFKSTVDEITLQPGITYQITVLPESSVSDVAFPVAPGSTTNLTANAPNLPSGLQFTYSTSSGTSTYSVACFNAFTSSGTLDPALHGVPLVGIPSFFCHITPANNGSITFGQTVSFDIVKAKPDRAVFEPDGLAQGFECTLNNSCNVPQFSVPATYQNFIAGNVQDLRLCVPAKEDVDCNGVGSNPQGGKRTSVSKHGDFQLLVADDPTYKPGTPAAPVPWDGIFRMSFSGPCKLNTGPDTPDGDQPPGYTDRQGTGIGPNAELDVTPTGSGTCSITATEDGRFITDYSDPQHPKPRSTTVSVSIW